MTWGDIPDLILATMISICVYILALTSKVRDHSKNIIDDGGFQEGTKISTFFGG